MVNRVAATLLRAMPPVRPPQTATPASWRRIAPFASAFTVSTGEILFQVTQPAVACAAVRCFGHLREVHEDMVVLGPVAQGRNLSIEGG